MNYTLFQCITQQPVGLGKSALLTSLQDGQAILFSRKPDCVAEVCYESAEDALELFIFGVATRQAAAIQTVRSEGCNKLFSFCNSATAGKVRGSLPNIDIMPTCCVLETDVRVAKGFIACGER